jgi:plastocyanin
MRRYLLIGTAAALLAIPALATGATTTITVAPNNSLSFGPKSVIKNVGAGSIHWQWGTNGTTSFAHNVRQDNNLFSSGAPTASKPAGYTITPSAGSFHYYCTLHGAAGASTGMVGTINIRPAIFNKTASSFGVKWSPGTNQTGNAFDVRYRVDGGTWKTWMNDVTTAQAVFGANNSPVHVGPGHTYEVEARSEKLSNVSKPSGWSPLARVTT